MNKSYSVIEYKRLKNGKFQAKSICKSNDKMLSKRIRDNILSKFGNSIIKVKAI